MSLTTEQKNILVLFNLEEENVESTSFRSENDQVFVAVTLCNTHPPCPACGCEHTHVKGYVLKVINHSLLQDRKTLIEYHARRYQCPVCHRTYYEHNPFVHSSMKISALTVRNVLENLKKSTETFASVAQRHYISPTTAASIFDRHVSMARLPLPELMCWDETYAFHHKGEDSKYVFVILDFITLDPVDILPSRRKDYLTNYFSRIPKEERDKVKMIATDMYDEYRRVIRDMFPDCLHCVDHYHVIQDLNRKVDRIRVRVMKSVPKYITDTRQMTNEYYLLKKFNWLIYKRPDTTETCKDEYGAKVKKALFDPGRERKYNRKLERMLNYYDIRELLRGIHPDLKNAWLLKDEVIDFYTDNTHDTAPDALKALIRKFNESDIKEMNEFAGLLRRWSDEIINSFIVVDHQYSVDKETGHVAVSDRHLNTGLLENRNSIIKCIKKNANGYQNWERFRNRCLYVLRKDAVPSLNPIEKKRK